MKARGTSFGNQAGHSVIAIVILLVVIIGLAAALVGLYLGDPQKAELKATVTDQAETIKSFEVMFMNIFDPEPGGKVTIIPSASDGRTVSVKAGEKLDLSCVQFSFDDWTGSGQSIPRSLMCPPTGYKVFTAVVWADQYFPSIGAQIMKTKVLLNIRGAQLFVCPDGEKGGLDQPKCKAMGDLVPNPKYDQNRRALDPQKDARVAKACSNLRKVSAGQVFFDKVCEASILPGGNLVAYGPGFGMRGEESFLFAYNGQGASLMPMLPAYLKFQPATGTMPNATPPVK